MGRSPTFGADSGLHLEHRREIGESPTKAPDISAVLHRIPGSVEILKHSDELAGRRVRLTVDSATKTMGEELNIRPENLGALEVLRELRENPLTDEERKTLEDLGNFRGDHPFRFRRIEDGS